MKQKLPAWEHQQAYKRAHIQKAAHLVQLDHFPAVTEVIEEHSGEKKTGLPGKRTNLVICFHWFTQAVMDDKPNYK